MVKRSRPRRGSTSSTAAAPATEAKAEAFRLSAATIGSTGLKHSGGVIVEEFIPELRGARGARKYREMVDNDFVCGAVIFAITSLVRSVDWTVQAADESAEAEAGKAFLEEVLLDMDTPWDAVISEICTMFPHGFAPMEVTFKRRSDATDLEGRPVSKYPDGKVGVGSIALRSQETIDQWSIDDESGKILGFWQVPWNRPRVFIPAPKMMLFRTEVVRNNPTGRSILRSAYRAWYFKSRMEEIEAIGVERDLAGLPMLHIPVQYMDPNASPQDKAVYAAYKALVSNVRRDKQEGLILPSTRDKDGNLLVEFKLLSTGGARSFDTNKVLSRYDRGIATAVLADFIFLGQQAVGSFALSSDKTALFATALEGFLKHSIAGTLNDRLVSDIWRLNGLPPETQPKLVPGDIEEAGLAEVVQFITAMASAGQPLFPDRELENALRRKFNLPLAPEDGEDMDTPRGPMPGAENDGAGGKDAAGADDEEADDGP